MNKTREVLNCADEDCGAYDSDSVTLMHITTVPQSLLFLKGQVRHMQSQGLRVNAVSSPAAELLEFGQAEGVSVFPVPMTRRITPLRDLMAVYRLWKHLRHVRPQIVHSHTPKAGLLGMIAASLAGVPVRIYHIRGLPLMAASGWKRRLLWCTEKIACALAHQVLCVSHSVAAVAVSETLCPTDKIKTPLNGSGNGVDAAGRFHPAHLSSNVRNKIRAAYGIPRQAPLVGYMGRVVRDKGWLELARAWRVVRAEFPHAHLLVVGPLEAQNAIPPEALELLQTDPHIHLAGFQRETPPFYAALDVLVLPTYREGFPNVLLEAAAMELPVVATRIPGCVDAVEDDITGTLVPVRNAQALAAGLRRYLEAPMLRQQHGRAARARALRDYRPEAIWEAVFQEYLRLLAKRELATPHLDGGSLAAARRAA